MKNNLKANKARIRRTLLTEAEFAVKEHTAASAVWALNQDSKKAAMDVDRAAYRCAWALKSLFDIKILKS